MDADALHGAGLAEGGIGEERESPSPLACKEDAPLWFGRERGGRLGLVPGGCRSNVTHAAGPCSANTSLAVAGGWRRGPRSWPPGAAGQARRLA